MRTKGTLLGRQVRRHDGDRATFLKTPTPYVVALALLALSGCTTTLTHEQLKLGMQPAEPGFSYYLPRQRFSVTATYELKDCPDAASNDAVAASRKLVISQTVSIVETPVVDPGELYSIPLSTLTAPWKTTTLTGTVYENQTIHTIGATADDRTAAVTKGALGTVLSLARVAIGAPTAAKQSLCQPDIYKALDKIREGQTKLQDATVDEKGRAVWSAIITAARTGLQISETYIFDPSAASLEVTRNPSPAKLVAWFANPQLIASAAADQQLQYSQTLKTGIRIRDVPAAAAAIPEALKGQGIIYREPAPVVVQVCAGSCGVVQPEVLATLETQAAQFGRYAVIPLVNKAFQKNNLTLSFAANGRLESFTYGSESTLEKMAASLSESATAIEGFLAKRKSANDAAEQAAAGAELKTLKAETDLLKAKADKIEAEAKLANLMAGK